MRTYEVVSADSHLEVPPDQWRAYVDKEFQDYVPKVVRLPDGSGDAWEMPGGSMIPLGLQFAITRPGVENRYVYSKPTGISYGPDLVGTGDGHQRLREMDQDGVDADLLFPAIFGTPRSRHSGGGRRRNLPGLQRLAVAGIHRGRPGATARPRDPSEGWHRRGHRRDAARRGPVGKCRSSASTNLRQYASYNEVH